MTNRKIKAAVDANQIKVEEPEDEFTPVTEDPDNPGAENPNNPGAGGSDNSGAGGSVEPTDESNKTDEDPK